MVRLFASLCLSRYLPALFPLILSGISPCWLPLWINLFSLSLSSAYLFLLILHVAGRRVTCGSSDVTIRTWRFNMRSARHRASSESSVAHCLLSIIFCCLTASRRHDSGRRGSILLLPVTPVISNLNECLQAAVFRTSTQVLVYLM